MGVFAAVTSLLIVSLILYLPVQAIIRAKKYNVQITLYDAFLMGIRKTALPELFQAISEAQKHALNLNLSDLEVHLIAGGNPVNVVETLIKYKSYTEILPKQVFAYDLSKMDFDAFASQLIKTHNVSLTDIAFSVFKVDYKAIFKLSPDSPLLNSAGDHMEHLVKNRLKQLSGSWNSADRQYTENFLKTQVFNEFFWSQEIKAKLISQKLTVYG